MAQSLVELKQKLLYELEEARATLLEWANAFEPAWQDTAFLGTWTIKDLLAHLIGWDYTNIQAGHDLDSNQLPQFYAYHDRDWRAFNARLVDQYKTGNFPELLEHIHASHQALIAYLTRVPPLELDLDRGIRYKGWKVTLARLLQAEAKDERTHSEQIRQFVEKTRFEKRHVSD